MARNAGTKHEIRERNGVATITRNQWVDNVGEKKYSTTSHQIQRHLYIKHPPVIISGRSPLSFPLSLAVEMAVSRQVPLLLLLLCFTLARADGPYKGGEWKSAHATFYGESDGSGTTGEFTLLNVAGRRSGSKNQLPEATSFLHKFARVCWVETVKMCVIFFRSGKNSVAPVRRTLIFGRRG